MLQQLSEPFIIAHRGASAYFPENTLAAMQKAYELGAKMVEFDVQLANCSTPIIFHDDDLQAFNGTAKTIADYNFEELTQLEPTLNLKRFTAGGICSLEALLITLKKWQLSVNIELKSLAHQNGEQLIKHVLEVISKINFSEQHILFSSFDLELLLSLRKQFPTVAIATLFTAQHEPASFLKQINSIKPWSINILEPYIQQASDLSHLQTLAPKVYCATVNDKVRAQQLFDYGVNAIFSDLPDLLTRMEA